MIGMEDSLKICIINNYPVFSFTDRIERMEYIIESAPIDVDLTLINYQEFSTDVVERQDGIILTGSSLNVSDFYHDRRLRKKFDPLIRFLGNDAHEIPVLGICFGFHLVAFAHGAHVCRMTMRQRVSEIIFIALERQDSLITEKNIPVNVFHRDYLHPNDMNLHEHFEIISKAAVRDYAIVEYMHHRKKAQFAMQFHPETHPHSYFSHFVSKPVDEAIINKMVSVGESIFHNFLYMCTYTKQESTSPPIDGD
ncbi:hypothetical protein GF325_17190 [Candidatus Bathyarchaeota archaeon]|nr:hypothetical protein [Candidatus Bathyarchaeota archaeon]